MLGVLPESVGLPPFRQRADGASIVSDPQWVGRTEHGTITSAILPPIGGGVDHWGAVGSVVVKVGEVADPVNHRRWFQAITGDAIWVFCPTNVG